MREVIEHLRDHAYTLDTDDELPGNAGWRFTQAADALELLEKLREHPFHDAMVSELSDAERRERGFREYEALLLQLLKGGE